MITHDLKIWPEHFEAVLSGLKKAELRLDDRGYAAGDILLLREWNRFGNFYTGRQTTRKVAHVGRGLGLAPGYVLLSLEDPDAARRGVFFHQLAEALEVRPVHGAVEEEALLQAVAELRALAGPDARYRFRQVRELVQDAHATSVLGSGAMARQRMGEAAALLAALVEGRA